MNLLIHFFQCAISPPILSSLIRFYPHLDPLQYLKNDLPKPIQPESTQAMAFFLFGFFTCYFQFDLQNQAISIRAGNAYNRHQIDEESTKKMRISNLWFTNWEAPSPASDVEFAPFRASCKKFLESLTSLFELSSRP
ncbi:hypothetical protein PENTCL1PPCAC_20042, partial [Pristionchus entomophagus]